MSNPTTPEKQGEEFVTRLMDLVDCCSYAETLTKQSEARDAVLKFVVPHAQQQAAVRNALDEYLEAQDALDNREYMGINGEDYFVLLRRRNSARTDLDAALALAAGGGK
jgi:hypothetical protein